MQKLEAKAARPSGLGAGSWVEVTGKFVRSAGSSEGARVAFAGTEAAMNSDLSDISDGELMTVPQTD